MSVENVYIPIDLLQLDFENPRLGNDAISTDDAITQLIKKLGSKLVVLANDIANYGIDPSQALIVYKQDDEIYRVLEGNRRLAAIWMLLEPSTVKGKISEVDYKHLDLASKKYLSGDIIDKVLCSKFDSIEEAQHWIELKHTGENDGAGVIPWGAQEVRRHQKKIHKKFDPALSLLDYLEQNGFINNTQRANVPITNFERIIRTGSVKKKLGLKIEKDSIDLNLNINTTKILVRVVKDLSRHILRVKDLYTAKQRSDYINLLWEEIIGEEKEKSEEDKKKSQEKKTKDGKTKEDNESNSKDDKEKTKRTSSKSTSHSSDRYHLIPDEFILNIPDQRITNVYYELRTLEIDKFPNAVAVLFRLFLEFSSNYYFLENDLVENIDKLKSYKLDKKVKMIAEILEKDKKWSKEQTLPFLNEVNQPDSMYSIANFHSYIHNHLLNPNPMFLKTTWDNFEPLLREIWEK